MKILVLGSRGMLGSDLLDELSETNHEALGYDIEDIDITKKEKLDKIKVVNPKAIINCAAYTNVDLAEKEKDKCYQINVIGVKNLVGLCKERGLVLVQISTDYVFDGNKEGYDENDKKNPINYYGKTKAEGEDIIIDNLEDYYIIRTSWLFGKNGKNFVSTITKLCNEKDSLDVVDDQIGNPTYTRDLSKAIIDLILSKKPFGIYHITNSGSCSWFQYAKEIARLNNTGCEIRPIKSEDMPRPSKRPKFSILNNNKTQKLKNWKEALVSYIEESE